MHLFVDGKPLVNHFKECLISLKWAYHQPIISKRTHASVCSWQTISKLFQRVSYIFEVGQPSANHFKENSCISLKLAIHQLTISKSVLYLLSGKTVSKIFQRRLMHLYEVSKPLANHFKEDSCISLKLASLQQTTSTSFLSFRSRQTISKPF